MRTLVLLALLWFCLSCDGQQDTVSKQLLYTSFSGRYYSFDGNSVLIQKTVTFDVEKGKLTLHTANKTSEWPLKSMTEIFNDDEKIDSYETKDGQIIRLIYSDGDLVDIVFRQDFITYHFFISYPLSL